MDSAVGDSGLQAEATRDDPTLRVAFVGQGVYFRACALESPAGGIEPTYLDFRAGASAELLLGALRKLDPDVILVFRPEIVPEGLFASLRGMTIGYLTEPLPRNASRAHPDLVQRLGWLQQADRGNFDRLISFDPFIAETAADVLTVWRSLPIPVADSLFMDVRERAQPARLLFIGRSTAHRERMLAPIKGRYQIVHFGHGLAGEELGRFLTRADVQLNLHNNPYPTYENRVSVGLAAGHLMISEPLSPRHGLRPGQDYLEADRADAMAAIVAKLVEDPTAHLEIQHSGRRKAEQFRASRVYPRLIREGLADVAARGSDRSRT